MSRRVGQAPVSVEALLPSLGALSVNHTSAPKQAPIAAGEKKRQKKKGDGDDEEETGPRLGVLPTDPGTGQPVKWVREDDKLDQDAHKRLVYAQNKEWASFYPPPPPQKRPEEYSYTDWTSLFPAGNLQIENPHWLRAAPDNPRWPASRNKHDSLSEARTAFVDMLPEYLQALPQPTEKNSVEERSKREADIANRDESLAQLKEIVEKDGDKTASKDLEQSRVLIAQMFRQDGVFGQYKRKKAVPFPPPPGWMVMYKARTVASMEAQLAKKKGTKSEGKPGAFSDPAYVGPQYASWSEQDPSTKLYSAILQDSPVQAWLVYLMYQKSSKTFDPREQARRKDATEEAKQRAAANAAKRKEQSAQQMAKLEKDRADRKRAAEEERDAALAEANEQSRRAAQNDLPEGGGEQASEEDLIDLLGDGPADAPVPASAEDDGDDDEVPANADPAEAPEDALMRMLNDALNDD